MPDSGSTDAHTNRLSDATSPYLLQHAHNPVDWYPWGEEALERARREDRPIFLSIGYSSCHWCHVMERESFENEAIAQVMNEHFINIKVDREERPDLDEIYMNAVQAMTGQGGWPMSVFLTPDLRPFFGGTYYPPDDRYGRPGFPRLLMAVAESYKLRRKEVEEGADRLTGFLEQHAEAGGAAGPIDRAIVTGTADLLVSRLDSKHGGFGGAPKFPQPMNLSLIMQLHARQPNAQYEEAVRLTLDRMAQGGMYDQLAGGFHRYSVDVEWLVPHFEKMLYDNALLARTYLEAHQLFGDPYYKRVATEILDYVLREMTSEEGGFHSATDADSEGVEGKFFVWSPDEIVAELGADEGDLFCRFYDVTKGGNFEGQSILRVRRSEDEFARAEKIDAAELSQRLASARQKLQAVRARRVPPFLDDKIITSWNALMIGSLARGFRATGDVAYRDAAARAAELIWGELRSNGRLYRTRRAGRSQLDAYLEDYAFLADGYLDLYEATFDSRWLERAIELVGILNAHFEDAENGGYFFTSDDHEQLLTRSKNLFDNAIPGGNSMAVGAQIRLSRYTGDATYLDHVERALGFARPLMKKAPGGFGQMLQAVERFTQPSREIVIAGPLDDSRTAALVAVVGHNYLPDAVVAHAPEPASSELTESIPLIEGKTMVNGEPAAYVCENFACQAPVTSADALAQALGDAGGR